MVGPASNDDWLDSIKVLAEELRGSCSDVTYHDELMQLLEKWQHSRDEIDTRYTILLSFFLGTLKGVELDVDVTALAARLVATRTTAGNPISADVSAEEHLNDLLQSFGGGLALQSLSTSKGTVKERRRSAPPPGIPASSKWLDNGHDGNIEAGTSRQNRNSAEPGTQTQAGQHVNSAYRMHLDRKHGEIDKLQEILSSKAMEAMNQNKEFGSLLETERAALQQASSVEEIELLKEILIGGTDELIDGQRQLAEKLRSSFEYLQLVKSDSQQLHEELHKVRLLSLTDEFTGLPNRRAFVRRLSDEISRVSRYDVPLSLAIIDLDHFKQINDKYGHPVGDAVLVWYARNALPTFRHYDMVARYGGEEFAVLFPNTTYDGAHRALKKMRQRIEYARCESGGHSVSVPTFSAGLTVFQTGDTQEVLIKRADEALYIAKNRGRDRIEMLIPEGARQAEHNESTRLD